MAVVEDLEGVRVLAIDVSHQLLVGEPLEPRGVRVCRCRHRNQHTLSARCRINPISGRESGRAEPGPARLYALAAGGFLALLGVLGFFFDAGFETGKQLAADDVAGIIVVNGWRNVVYLRQRPARARLRGPPPAAARRPSSAASTCVLGLWGVAETDHDIGSILEVLPLTDEDNVFHLVIGGLGAIAALADGPLPKLPKPKRGGGRGASGSRSSRPAKRSAD